MLSIMYLATLAILVKLEKQGTNSAQENSNINTTLKLKRRNTESAIA